MRRVEATARRRKPAHAPNAKTARPPSRPKRETRAVKAETRAAKASKGRDPRGKNDGKGRDDVLQRPTTEVTPTTPTTHAVKKPEARSAAAALLPPGTTIQDASHGIQELGPVRRRGARLEQSEYSVRRSEGEDDRPYAWSDAGTTCRHADVARAGDSVVQGQRRSIDGADDDEIRTK